MRLLKFLLSIFFVLLEVSIVAQSNKKLLIAGSKFFAGSIHDSIIFLSESGDSIKSTKISFLPNGRLKLESLKTAADTQWYYNFINRELYISLVRNDSMYQRSYEIVGLNDGRNFQLNRIYNYAAPVARPGESNAYSDSAPQNNLILQRNNRKKTIYENDEISVFYAKRGTTHDSLEFMARGDFQKIISDTVFLNASQLETHDFYKKYTDSLHHTSFFPDSLMLVKIPVKELTGVYYHRTGLSSVMTLLTITGFICELVFIPAALFSKSEKNNLIFGNLALASIATWPTAFTAGVLLSKKKFRLKETAPKQKIWRIVREE